MHGKRVASFTVLTVVLWLCVGCAGPGERVCFRGPAGSPNQDLLEGYALLYALASREKDVDTLLPDGVVSPGSQQVIREIAQVNRDLVKSLRKWATDSPGSSCYGSSRPELESRSRELTRDNVAWQLLLSGRGECTKTFLLAQHRALVYEAGLLRAIHGSEGCEQRRAETGEYAQRVDRLSARVADLIRVEE